MPISRTWPSRWRSEPRNRRDRRVSSEEGPCLTVRLFGDLRLANPLRPVHIDAHFPDFVDLALTAQGKRIELVAEITAPDFPGDGAVPDVVDTAVADVSENLLAAVVDAAQDQVTVEHDVGLLEQAAGGRVGRQSAR